MLAPSGTTLPVTALQLADAQRKVMHVLGRELAPLMSLARDFAAGLVDHATLSAEVRRYRALMLEHTYPAAGVADRIKARLVELVLPVAVPVLKKINREALRAKAPLEPFARPIRVREEELAGSKLEKWEVGRYLQAASPEMRQAMAELAAEGGELRRPVVQHEDGTVSPQTAAAYFRLDEQGRPIVGLDVGQDWALAGLEHEMTHFRLWRARRDELLAAGMDPAQAGRAAFAHWNEPLQRVAGERAALGAEMNVETRRSPFNQGAARPPRSPEDSGFVERMCYPELEGIREIFHRARWGDLPLDVDTATNLFDHVVRTAEALRREAFERRRALAAKLEKSPDVRVRSEGYLLREHAHRERAQPLFDLVASWMTRARFASDQTLAQFDDFLAAALIRAGLRGEAAELNRRSALVAQQ